MEIKPKRHLDSMERPESTEPSRMFKRRLDRNERNQPFSRKFVEEVKRKITDELFMVYPEMGPVYEKVAAWLGIDKENLMLHSGSEQTIKAVFETYIGAGDKILLHFPGYAMYAVYAKMFQATVRSQSYDSDLTFDWDAYCDKVDKKLRMVVIENPNGFVGTAPPQEAVEKIIKRLKDKASSFWWMRHISIFAM